MMTGTVGQRIAAYRRRRGLSQAALAGLVGRSESWLSQVERGLRSVDRLSVMLDLARILHVEVESLTGRPWKFAPNGAGMTAGIDSLRRVFTRYDHLLANQTAVGTTVAALRPQIAALHKHYQAAQYNAVMADLPPVMLAVEQARLDASTVDRREALLAYVSAYIVAAKLVTKLGAGDLAMLAADRAVSAACSTESEVASGMAVYQVACALLRADQPQDAELLAVGMAEKLGRSARSDAPTLVSVAGSLWLIAAIIAARQTDRDGAWDRLRRADQLAALLGDNANHAWTAFGPTNVAIHRVSAAAELGDAAEALRVAATIDVSRLPESLASRRAQMHLDLAWAQAQRKRDAEATLHLLEAERVAPEALVHNVIAQELVREMLARGSRVRTSALYELATRAGLFQ